MKLNFKPEWNGFYWHLKWSIITLASMLEDIVFLLSFATISLHLKLQVIFIFEKNFDKDYYL